MNISVKNPVGFEIGAELDTQFNEIRALSTRLRGSSGDDYENLLDPIDSSLNKAIGSVSLIGQVKAGKTSLINSLIERSQFLPSDVNPWTAVVTRLYFGKPDGPEKGADFSFFSNEEWDKFANRGGRLGELAEAIPGSEDKLEEIRIEVEKMRQRAKMQLGDKFESLLGGTHKFGDATQDVLARYICVGDDPEKQSTTHVQGRFADITKDASIYFAKEKFRFPTAIVDTPGLNDPLLIREEITLQSLEHSDVFVLVLSAHQAFSSSDLYLLRVLNALRLDRLVVFVNRIDELSNPVRDIPKVRTHILKMLAQECPGADIPVIFGSAYLAERAIGSAETDDLTSLDAIYKINNNSTLIAEAKAKFSDSDREKLWVASGVPELEHQLSEMLSSGPGMVWRQGARTSLDNVTNIIRSDSQARLATLQSQQAGGSGGGSIDDVQSLELDLEHVEAELEKMFQKVNHALELSASAAWPRIQKGLRLVTETFTEHQDEIFATYLKETKSDKKRSAWTCDTAPLRRALNWYFREEFPKVQKTLLRKLEAVVEEVSESLADSGVTTASEIKINTAKIASQAPVTTALSKVVPFDMEPSWWKGWLSKFSSDTKVREDLSRMIRKQFLPIETELLASARDRLVGSSAEALAEFRVMQQNLLETLKKQEQDRASTEPAGSQDIDSQIANLEERIAICTEVNLALEQLLET